MYKYVLGCVAICGITLFGVVVACLGIDGVVTGAIIGTYILIVREIVGTKIQEKGKEEQEGEETPFDR